VGDRSSSPASPALVTESGQEPPIPVISHEELASRTRDASLTILDVLASESYRAGHIPGATSLPLEDLPERAPIELPDRDRDIAVYCSSHT